MALNVLLEFRGGMFAAKAVGIFSVGQQQQLHVHACRQNQVDTSLAGLYTGAVAVVNDRDVVGESADDGNLSGRQCGARRCHHVLHTVLVHGHYVGVAFHQIAAVLLADGLLGLEKSEQLVALAVHKAFGRVQILYVYALGGLVQYASAKARHSSALAEDGPYHTVAETVSQLSALLVLQAESGANALACVLLVGYVDEVFFLVSFRNGNLSHRALPVVGAVSHLELLQNVIPETA